jgi:archaellum biogenesis ATPase FlaH
MTNVLLVAEQYISAGLKCIPIHYAQKRPRNAKWSKEFLTFQQFKSLYQNGDGLGVVTGHCSMLFCIDIDQRSGGLIWYESKKDLLGNPLVEKTPGGGYHLYYQYPNGYQYIPSSNNYAPGVEIKADGGRQVVTAPSEKPSGKYTINNNLTLLDLVEFDFAPKWILDELFEKQRTTLALDPKLITDIEPDLEGAIRAISKMEPAKTGDGGDNKTYVAACKCRDYGLNQVMAYALLKEHFNPKCTPQWSDKDLKIKVNNAYNYGLNPPGVAIKPDVTPKVVKPTPFKASDWMQQEVQFSEPLLCGLFDKGDKVLIVGQSKTRKSFFSLQMSISLALGIPFFNFHIEGGKKVLLVQFEIKQDRYHSRISRMIKQMQIESPNEKLNNLQILNARGYGSKLEDLQLLIQENAKTIQPDIIVLDPLYKLIDGDESKAEDVKKILRYFDSLAESTGAAVVYIHHDKKGVAGDQQIIDRGAGSGVLARDADACIYLSLHADAEKALVLDFISRNHEPLKGYCIEWNNGAFDLSSLAPDKQTSRTQRHKRVLNSEWVEKATNMINEMRKFGDVEADMNLFNGKLKDLGIKRDALAEVKSMLTEAKIIQINKRKAEPGQSNKVVLLLGSAVEAQKKLNQTPFEAEFEDYLEQPF